MDVLFSAVVAFWFASVYGRQAGYRFYLAHDDLQANIYGAPTVFIAAFIVAYLCFNWFIWPYLRKTGNGMIFSPLAQRVLAFKRWRSKAPDISSGDIEQEVTAGKELVYIGMVDRDFDYYTNNRKRTKRIQVHFTLRHNTMAMTEREQAAVIILGTLIKNGHPDQYDRLLFAMTWCDGRCQVKGGKFTVDIELLKTIGVRTFKDFITLEAAHRDITVDGAISELFTSLQSEAKRRGAPPELNTLLQQYR